LVVVIMTNQPACGTAGRIIIGWRNDNADEHRAGALIRAVRCPAARACSFRPAPYLAAWSSKEATGVDAKPGLIARITTYVRNNGSHVLVEALVNFILPFLIYTYAEAPLGAVRALLASSAPPILWSLIEFARHRRIDALSVLVVSGIALSLLAMLGGGGARFLQLREKLVTGVIGLVFLGSALIGKPLIYELARASKRRKSAAEAEQFEALQVHAGFRRTMTVMTLVWGLGLLADVAVSVVLVFVLSIREYLLVNPILGYGTMGALSLWSFLYGRRAKRRGEARRAAGAADPIPAGLSSGG
jgi:hypothetical protein